MTVAAAVDCGTNSTRLLVTDGESLGHRSTVITRLGQGVDETGRLDTSAIDRSLECLRSYRDIIERHGVDRLRVIATSAVRDANNAQDFLDPAAAAIGAEVEVLSGATEAALGFAGATGELDGRDGPFLVLDIGGGSTEFSFGHDVCESAVSVDIGCVRLTEQFIAHDPPRPEELLACLSVTEAHLDDVVRSIPHIGSSCQLVGVAGTVTTAAAVEIGLLEYEREAIHHFRLTKEAAEDVYRTLATEDRTARLHNPGLEEARVDVIVAGLCVLVQVMRFFDFADCLVSESDILDGLALPLLD